MIEENINQEFRLRKVDETRNYFSEEIKNKYFVSKKYQKVCKVLNQIKQLPILGFAITECVSIFVFASLVVSSSAVGVEIHVRIVGIKKNKSMIEKRWKKIIK